MPGRPPPPPTSIQISIDKITFNNVAFDDINSAWAWPRPGKPKPNEPDMLRVDFTIKNKFKDVTVPAGVVSGDVLDSNNLDVTVMSSGYSKNDFFQPPAIIETPIDPGGEAAGYVIMKWDSKWAMKPQDMGWATLRLTYWVQSDTYDPNRGDLIFTVPNPDYDPNAPKTIPLDPNNPQGSQRQNPKAIPTKNVFYKNLACAWGWIYISPPPKLTYKIPWPKIIGVEVIQVTQHFAVDPNNPTDAQGNPVDPTTWNNSIPLVSWKPTIVRVYVDSGTYPEIVVTGSLVLDPQIDGKNTVFNPLNTNGTINARPTNKIDRKEWDHSLNFELPYDLLDGKIRIKVNVFVKGYENNFGWNDFNDQTVVSFKEHRSILARFKRVANRKANLPAPTAQDLWDTRDRAADHLPLSVYDIAPEAQDYMTEFDSGYDLTNGGFGGWGGLVTDLSYQGNSKETDIITIGVVSAVGINNLAAGGITQKVIFTTIATLPSKEQDDALAHELCHAFGINHSSCGPPQNDIDNTLPPRTDEICIDIPNRTIIPAGQGDLMGNCNLGNRWPSTKVYKGVFDWIKS